MTTTNSNNKIKTLRAETEQFNQIYLEYKGKFFKNNSQLANMLGYKTASSITEILKERQNVSPDKIKKFLDLRDEYLQNSHRGGENNPNSEEKITEYQGNTNTTNQNNTMGKEWLNYEIMKQLIIRINDLERQIKESGSSEQTNVGQ